MSGAALIGSVVDGDALLEVVWVSLVAGIGVTGAFGAGILGGTRCMDLSRSGRAGEAALFGLLALFGFAVVAGAVVFAIVVMTDK